MNCLAYTRLLLRGLCSLWQVPVTSGVRTFNIINIGVRQENFAVVIIAGGCPGHCRVFSKADTHHFTPVHPRVHSGITEDVSSYCLRPLAGTKSPPREALHYGHLKKSTKNSKGFTYPLPHETVCLSTLETSSLGRLHSVFRSFSPDRSKWN